MTSERTPTELREEVREGIMGALRRDDELRGGPTAGLLVTAGVLGISGAVAMVLLVSGHAFDQAPPWHLAVCTAIWSGLLVVVFAIAILKVRTPSLPLAQAARLAVVALGLAGLGCAICPDANCLDWWSMTALSESLTATGGFGFSAVCFGFATSVIFGTGAALLALGGAGGSLTPLLPAIMIVLLLAPGLVLQSFGTTWLALAGWALGTTLGTYVGVAIGLATRVRLGAT